MGYKFIQNLVSSSKYSIKCPYSMTPMYVTIHNTSNDATAANEITYMRNNNNQTSYHFAVDDTSVIQGVPENRNAWHAGDGQGTGNRKSIGIEICYSKSGGTRYYNAVENAVYVAARLLYKHKLGIDRLKKHQDWSGKYCPHRILDEGAWDNFKSRVEYVLNQIKAGNCSADIASGTTNCAAQQVTSGNKVTESTTPNKNTNSTTSNVFKVGAYEKNVKVTADSLNVRSARNASASIIGSLKAGDVVKVGYIMYEGNKTTGTSLWGGIVLNGKTGFICLSYCTPATVSTTESSNSKNVVTGTPSTFKVGTLNKKVRIINCDYLNTHSSRNLSSSTVVGKLKAGTEVTVGYIMYEGNKTTGTTLMGGVTIDGRSVFISMSYCQLV